MTSRIIQIRRETSLLRMILRWLSFAALGVAGAAALVYVGDWAVFYARGKPQDQIQVTRYMATPLKGHKTEYFYEGTQMTPCARALFPQDGMDACWYRRRHPLYSENL
jgi:hypothetical protein